MRALLLLLCSPLLATVLLWTAFAACVEPPAERGAPVARLVLAWDPLACGAPHRIAVDLADDAGVPISGSTPCYLGGLTIDLAHLGAYHGRIYAWALGELAHASSPIELAIDQPIVRWAVATPP